ncbi:MULTISPECIES: hypothetical protein [Hydrocarboniphaga]|uniref:hypothetical protein n=1 Tax=Hydrocarboniphaga TaxID=243627 RepID=UPI0012F9E497|nr:MULTISPECIES: hypothetical protein [Hydrocarboniphaga]MDZ4077616.1 hypothetical protein [Hydrocarboniphaga sp.]
MTRNRKAKTGDARLGQLSHSLAQSSATAAEAMDATSADGLSSPDVTVVVATPYGEVVSKPLPVSFAAELKEALEAGISRVQQLRVETRTGTTLIPGEVLRQSVIRFLDGRSDASAGVYLLKEGSKPESTIDARPKRRTPSKP